MRTISLILLVAALILGVGTTFSYGFNKSVCEDSSLAIKGTCLNSNKDLKESQSFDESHLGWRI